MLIKPKQTDPPLLNKPLNKAPLKKNKKNRTSRRKEPQTQTDTRKIFFLINNDQNYQIY